MSACKQWRACVQLLRAQYQCPHPIEAAPRVGCSDWTPRPHLPHQGPHWPETHQTCGSAACEVWGLEEGEAPAFCPAVPWWVLWQQDQMGGWDPACLLALRLGPLRIPWHPHNSQSGQKARDKVRLGLGAVRVQR